MKKLARTAGEGAHPVQAPVAGAPPEIGLPRMARGLRRLLRLGSRGSATVEAAGTEQVEKRDAGAHRSAMDAGITGGISLLMGEPSDRRRRD
jgi:hypothetical protein